MGRHNNPLQPEGEALGRFLRGLREESGLTCAQIAKMGCIGTSTISQGSDGRLHATKAPVENWISAFYRATDAYGISMSISQEAALEVALDLWQKCRDHQRALTRKPVVIPTAPGITTAEITGDIIPVPPSAGTPTPPDTYVVTTLAPTAEIPAAVPAPRPSVEFAATTAAALIAATPLPSLAEVIYEAARAQFTRPRDPLDDGVGIVPSQRRRSVLPASFVIATDIDELIDVLNNLMEKAYPGHLPSAQHHASGTFEGFKEIDPTKIDLQIHDVLAGRVPLSPGVAERVITMCGGTRYDVDAFLTVALPLLAALPARGRARVRSAERTR